MEMMPEDYRNIVSSWEKNLFFDHAKSWNKNVFGHTFRRKNLIKHMDESIGRKLYFPR